jgi:hypothetical protein
MLDESKSEERVRRFITQLALEGLADCEAKGIAIEPSVVRKCITSALKDYLDSAQAQHQLASVVDRAYEIWRHNSEAKAN